MKIFAETFKSNGTTALGGVSGTVEVDGIERNAVRMESGAIYIYGFIGKYRTSPKAWQASVSLINGRISVDFGRDDRSGRFQKQNMIQYAPDVFATLTNPKFWEAA